MGSRNQTESFGGGARTRQVSPRARTDCRGASGVLPWSLTIFSSQPAGREKLCVLESCEILATAVL